MYIHSFGHPDKPLILLLHPMGLTGTELYGYFADFFGEDFYVLSPDQGGHGHSGPYLSKQEETNQLITWLKDHQQTHIHMLFGASMGGALAYELVKRKELKIDGIWLDGVSLSDNLHTFCTMFTFAYFRFMSFAHKHPGTVIRLLGKLYPRHFAEVLLKNCRKLDAESACQIFRACCDYGLEPMSKEQQPYFHIELDSGEKTQMKAVRKYFPNADCVRNPRSGHCVNIAADPSAYLRRMEDWMKRLPEWTADISHSQLPAGGCEK